MSIRATAELEVAFQHANGGPLNGSAYSKLVPTIRQAHPEVVGFSYGFKFEGPGTASIDSPSQIYYFDVHSAQLVSQLKYSGAHKVMNAPPSDDNAAARVSALQDVLAPRFFAAPTVRAHEVKANALEYLHLFPRAVGDEHVAFYKELAPDWFGWLENAAE